MTGSLCGTDGPTLDILDRLDSSVMGVDVELTLHNCSVSQRSGLTFPRSAGKTRFIQTISFLVLFHFHHGLTETSASLAPQTSFKTNINEQRDARLSSELVR